MAEAAASLGNKGTASCKGVGLTKHGQGCRSAAPLRPHDCRCLPRRIHGVRNLRFLQGHQKKKTKKEPCGPLACAGFARTMLPPLLHPWRPEPAQGYRALRLPRCMPKAVSAKRWPSHYS